MVWRKGGVAAVEAAKEDIIGGGGRDGPGGDDGSGGKERYCRRVLDLGMLWVCRVSQPIAVWPSFHGGTMIILVSAGGLKFHLLHLHIRLSRRGCHLMSRSCIYLAPLAVYLPRTRQAAHVP